MKSTSFSQKRWYQDCVGDDKAERLEANPSYRGEKEWY